MTFQCCSAIHWTTSNVSLKGSQDFMGSFPDGGVAHALAAKTDKYYLGVSTTRPDLRMLALHAEHHGIDFRIVHLRRDPLPCILSRARVHAAKLGKITLDALAQIALDNDAALSTQLGRFWIPPSLSTSGMKRRTSKQTHWPRFCELRR